METADLIPIAIVTGFLGSGKTTLIKHLLSQPGFASTLVIVNEFGEVGIDHDLLEASSDDTILLANGCLCCTIRGNLVDTLVDVVKQSEEGRIGAFDRVVVETSGVADPAPLLGFLLGEAQVTARYRLDALIATCDLVSAEATLARHPEAQSQLRLADRILLTKQDLVDDARLARMRAQARDLNPQAEIVALVHGIIDPMMLVAPLTGPRSATVDRHEPLNPGDIHDHAPGEHHHEHGSHTERFTSQVFAAKHPLTREQVAHLVEALRKHCGPALLRVKGILPVDHDPRPLVVQGAMMAVHEPYFLAGTPGAGRLVIISEGAPPEGLLDAFAATGLVPAHF